MTDAPHDCLTNCVWVSYNREDFKNQPEHDHYRCQICRREWSEEDHESAMSKRGREKTGSCQVNGL